MTEPVLRWEWALRINCTDPSCYRMQSHGSRHSDHGHVIRMYNTEGEAIKAAQRKAVATSHYYEVVCRPVTKIGAGNWQKPAKPDRHVIKEVPL